MVLDRFSLFFTLVSTTLDILLLTYKNQRRIKKIVANFSILNEVVVLDTPLKKKQVWNLMEIT